MSAGRIRSVKPEWLEDERLAFASADARVMSIGLMLLADDYGNGRANVAWLRGQVFPGHESLDATREALGELVRLQFVILYEVDGQSYFSIRNWAKHQRVDKPGKPRVPSAPAPETGAKSARKGRASSRKTPETLRNESETPENTPDTPGKVPETLAPDLDLDQDLEGDQEGKRSDADASSTKGPPSPPSKPRGSRRVPASWEPGHEHALLAAEHGKDLDRELARFRDHEFPRAYTDWDATFRNWLRRENLGPRPSAGSQQGLYDPFEDARRLRAEQTARDAGRLT